MDFSFEKDTIGHIFHRTILWLTLAPEDYEDAKGESEAEEGQTTQYKTKKNNDLQNTT